ncbi:MAG: ABC transporter ATP-binding protein, partial [Comamonas sp.]|nr:ABC transporter ATP-binding protein [Comamonas sp.]
MTMQGWELQDIHLRRGQTPVFAGLHLQLHEARIGLIGFNGAGKTSLLRMLAGLDVPQQGRIVRQGETLHSAERGHAPSRRVGLMFQNPDDQIIFPTVQEELQLSWRSAHPGSSRAQAAQAVADFLQQRGLAHWAERAVGSLSQGQRQWVCWLAMRVAQPEVLLLDEPYASLDLPGQLRLAADIAACPQQVLVS